jgi:preprotein translocase subunit SecF
VKQLLLDYPEHEARLLIKTAFEQCPKIEKYKENQYDISGNTGARLGSFGVKIIAHFPENEENDTTHITIKSKRNISINITAHPERVEQKFMNQVEVLRGYSAEAIREHKIEQITSSGSQELQTRFSQQNEEAKTIPTSQHDIENVDTSDVHTQNNETIGFFKFAVLAIAGGFGLFVAIVTILLVVTVIL